MRIVGPNATARVAGPSATKRAGSGGFSVAENEAPRASQPVAALRTIGGIDALIALQGQDEKAGAAPARGEPRPGRARCRWTSSRSSCSPGALAPSTLMRLKSVTADLKDASGDDRLDAVLAEIELRVAVEIAKMTPR